MSKTKKYFIWELTVCKYCVHVYIILQMGNGVYEE